MLASRCGKGLLHYRSTLACKAQSSELPIFKFPKFDPNLIYCPYHENFISFLQSTMALSNFLPESLLEIGASLGRAFYEVCKAIPSITEATLIEPSQALAGSFQQLFSGTDSTFPIHFGNHGVMTETKIDTREIYALSKDVKRNLLTLPYELLPSEIIRHDLVICSNVIDQCKDPKALIQFLKDRTNLNGILALSCTYQWHENYLNPSEKPIVNVSTLFDERWELLGKTNLEYRFRRNERFWSS